MKIERTRRSQKLVHELQAGVEHIEVGCAVWPSITIAVYRAPFGWAAGIFATPDSCSVSFAGEEWRVDVDQVNPFLPFR